MSSFTRNLQRKVLRQGKTTTDDDGQVTHIAHEPQPQRVTMLPNGGYVTVRYTKGPLRVSPRRLAAQMIMASKLDHTAGISFGSTAKPRRVYREPAAAVPGTVTRQQIRFARRKGLPSPVAVAPVKPKRVRKTARVDGVAMTSEQAANTPRKPRAVAAA